ncbi:MAG TPA: shikimate kinase [Terrimicrobiaceae bacterium]
MLPNLILVGFMGCGKSSVGRRLSGLTGHRFVDTDELIVHAEGRTIAEIFAQNGEEYFRGLEQRSLEDLVGVCGIILSTGGGLVLRTANRETLKRIGIVAWLDAHPDVLFERAMRSGKRPLLQTEDPRNTFDGLLAVRCELYEMTADFRVDSSRLSHDEAAQMVLEEALRKHRRF